MKLGITKAVSTEPKIKSIKNSHDLKHHIVQPKGKSKKFYECNCRLCNRYKICQHTPATSVDVGNCFDYLMEAKNKILQGNSSLIEAIETTRKITEREMKNNVGKKAAVK